jgi:hypothetical protein
MAEGFNDKEVYRRCSIPFDSQEEANAAIDGFFKELRELRIKYEIADVLTVISDSALFDGEEGQFYATSVNGNSQNAAAMAAYALGQQNEVQREHIARLVRGQGTTTGK